MSYSNDWDTTDNPADHSKFKNIPASVRKVRTDVEERLQDQVYGFTSGETDKGFKHAQFKNQAGNPSTPAAGFTRLFQKAIGTLMRFFVIDENALVSEVSLESKGADIASATTTDLSAATGRYVVITGTTTITGLGTAAAGTIRRVTFSGILLLTYNATSLILPTAADITTAAGDTAEFVSLGSGNWKCLRYSRADGTSLVSPAHPSGSIQMWAGALASPPSGWLACDGATFSATTYPTLAGIVGDLFGVHSGDNYYLPNFTNKFPYGASEGASAGNASVGSSRTAQTLSANDSSVKYSFTYPPGPTSGSSVPTSPYSGLTQDVMPPYLAIGFIIKT